MEPLSNSLGVSLLTKDVVVCPKIAYGYLLMLCEHVLEVNLVVFNLVEFDIILVMDWLS